LDVSVGGTKERVDRDLEGRVRRVQRYYDSITWPFTTGVCCTFLPVAATLIPVDLDFLSLGDLRRALAARGVPSRDFPLRDSALDLSQEAGLLAFSEGFVFSMAGGQENGLGIRVGNGQRIHPSARIVGPVVLHPDVTIDEDVTILGPSVIG